MAGYEIQSDSTDRMILYAETGVDVPLDLSFLNTSITENCTIVLTSPELGFIVVKTPPDDDSFYQNEFLTIPWVSGVEPDFKRTPSSLYNGTLNDPEYPDQWAFNRTYIPEAWDLLSSKKSSSNISVAVIDTGIDRDHEDLDGVVSALGFDWAGNQSDTHDMDGHGTFLAGIVGSVANNGKGISGVARVSLLPERVGSIDSGILASQSAVAIHHAAKSGAHVILMGYGGPGQSRAEEVAIAYAARKGCILVAPAGNSASNEGHYPSDYFEVISVGSTAKTDGLSYFSNYGIFVDLVAPGEGIISTWSDNSYQTATGTSPAAALVAGAAALLLEAEPTLEREEVREILAASAGDLGRTGRDIYYGYGLLDVAAAVKAAQNHRFGSKKSTLISDNQVTKKKVLADDYIANESPDLSGVKRKGPLSMESAEVILNSGWNFISLPSIPGSAKTSSEIFKGINTDGHTIWKYDATAQDWISVERDSNFTPLEGFLIYSDRQTLLPLVLDNQSAGHQIPMRTGWNLIGSPYNTPVNASYALSSLSADWASLLMFNSSTQIYDPAIIPGASGIHSDARILPPFSAFWVYMNKEGSFMSAN
jgi:thermitase